MSDKPKVIYPYSDEKIFRCRSCPKRIYFYVLPSGKKMPVNFETNESHFIDCPGANKLRKRKQA